MDQALSRCQRDRDAAVMPMYESTCQRARLQPLPPEVHALFRALQKNQDAANSFFGLDAGTVPIPKFFSPDNLKRIMNPKPQLAPLLDDSMARVGLKEGHEQGGDE